MFLKSWCEICGLEKGSRWFPSVPEGGERAAAPGPMWVASVPGFFQKKRHLCAQRSSHLHTDVPVRLVSGIGLALHSQSLDRYLSIPSLLLSFLFLSIFPRQLFLSLSSVALNPNLDVGYRNPGTHSNRFSPCWVFRQRDFCIGSMQNQLGQQTHGPIK